MMASAECGGSGNDGKSASNNNHFVSVATLTGHKDSVLCLGVSNNNSDNNTSNHHLIGSGSEDGTGRIWDLRNNKSIRMIQSFKKQPINSIAFSSEYLYFAAGRKIGCYDLRRPEIILPETAIAQQFEFNTDEINQITINSKGTHLAACDDNGEIKIVDIQKGGLHKKLKPKTSNICSSVQFRDDKPHEVISGGFDSMIYQWDFTKERILYKYKADSNDEIQHSASNTSKNKGQPEAQVQIFNPPYIHSLSVYHKYVAAALGNMKVVVFDLSNGKLLHQLHGHSSSVSQVQFAAFNPQKYLISGGNDSNIILWDLSNTSSDPPELIDGSYKSQQLTQRYKHNSKVNWLVSTIDSNVIIADQSDKISVFHLV